MLKEKIKFNKKYLYTSPSNTLSVNNYNFADITLLQQRNLEGRKYIYKPSSYYFFAKTDYVAEERQLRH